MILLYTVSSICDQLASAFIFCAFLSALDTVEGALCNPQVNQCVYLCSSLNILQGD